VAFLIICISAVQFIIFNVFNILNGSMITDFIDLCTLANMSIVIMDEHTHGYYIHAKAPWGSSDIPLDWLQKELQDERDNKLSTQQGRGLKQNSKNISGNSVIQTFQIYLPVAVSRELNKIKNESAPIEAIIEESSSFPKSKDKRGKRKKVQDPDSPVHQALKDPDQMPDAMTQDEFVIRQEEHKKL